jgi:hypothetical protein
MPAESRTKRVGVAWEDDLEHSCHARRVWREVWAVYGLTHEAIVFGLEA